METWYRLDRWTKNIDEAKKEVTRSTDKTVFYKTRTGHETSERKQSNYHKWYESREDAVKEICARLQSERDAAYKKQLSAAAPALLEALESARSFIFRHAQTDCNTGELICKKTEAELIKIDAAIAAARGE